MRGGIPANDLFYSSKQQLQGAYERGQLKNALYQYWAQQVPKIFFTSAEVAISTQRTHDAVQAEEKLSRDVLFEPLEWFLCGGNPAAVFQQLQSLNNPPQLCGKVFKVGEPTYSCRDCCADPTCVFCIECFNKSTHKTHRYRMSTSGGGGYCDCGDVEAWKQDPWCDIHKQGLGQQSQVNGHGEALLIYFSQLLKADWNSLENPIEKLPKDVAARAWEVLKIALQYAVDILLWEQMDGLPQDLEPSVQQNTYVTMLFNDEIHTYEQVINALTRAISCQQKEAVEFATVVDREGRSSVRYGNRKSCDQARSIIQRSTSLRSKPLKVEVMHTSVCAHQAFAQKVLNWLGQVVNHSAWTLTKKLENKLDGTYTRMLRAVLNKSWKQHPTKAELYGTLPSLSSTIRERRRSTSLRSKPLKVEVMHTSVCAHQAFAQKVLNWLGQVVNHSDGLRHILCTTALQQPPTGDPCVVERLMLADTALWKIARVQCHQIMMGSLLMDQESKKQFSVLYTRNYPQVQMDFMADDHDHGVSIISLSVQIFTVPTLARYLIMEHDLLAIVIRTFLEQCASCRHGRYLLDREKLQKNFRRLQFPLLDLKYVLSMVPDQWNDQLKRKFMNGFKIMAELLTSMQGMDSVTRQVGQHIEMEPEWESAFNLQIKLAPAVAMMAGWCATDKMVLIDAFRIAVKALLEISQLDTVKKCKRRVCDQEAIVVDYTVSREPVSIHLPICRLLAGLYLQLGKYGLTFNSPELYGPLQPPIAMDLLEQPLKTLVMIAQVHAEMWKRNGYSLFHQGQGWFFSAKDRDGSSGTGMVLQCQGQGWFFSAKDRDGSSVPRTGMVLQCQGQGWFFSAKDRDGSSVLGTGMVLQYQGQGWFFSAKDRDGSSVPRTEMVLQCQEQGWFFSAKDRDGSSVLGTGMVLQCQGQGWFFSTRDRDGSSVPGTLMVYYYHNVRCRSEMQDKDIIMLQASSYFYPRYRPDSSKAAVACAQMDPNQFLIALLNKFELMNWIEGDFDDFIRLFFYGRRRDVTEKGSSATDDLLRFTNSLVEEFLNFLIIIIGERYVPGIGQVSSEDMVKREVIHQLCISPMAHSDLSKALPENHKHETGMEAVIADVSTFKKPGVTGMGRYELKPEFYKDYNPFFYHYTRADQSKASILQLTTALSEEAQLKRKKQEGESTACPPPEMPALSKEFSGLVNVLECDVFVHTIRTVFRRVNSSRSRSWTEAMVHRALHLVGMALNEEKRLYQTSPYIRFNFVKKATEGGSNSLYSALHDLLGKPRIQNHADLLTWAIDRFDEVKALKEQKQVMSDAQKAKKVSSKSKTDAERKKKAEAARKRREKILAQMSDMQKSFIRDNLELFEATGTELSSSPSMEVEGSPMVAPSQYPVAVGPDRSPATHVTLTTSTCILCQEDQEVSVGNKCVVLAAYVQRSTALSKSRGRVLEDPDKYDPLLVSPDLYHGVHTSTCGHVMHADCWQRFYEAIVAKEQRRALRFRHILSYEVDRGEFLCPLCETLSNTVIPILPPSTTIQPDSVSVDISLSFSDWLDGLKKTVEASQRAMMKEEEDKMESSDDLPVLSPCPLPSITKNMAEMAAQGFQQLFEYMTETGAQAPYSDSVKEMMKLFSRATYTNMLHDPPLPTKASDSAATYNFGLGLDPNDDDDRVPITAWGTCAYTIRTLVMFCIVQADCITALVRVVTVSGSLSDPQTISKSALRLLSALLPQEPMKNVPCILDVDMFFTLVFLHVTFPSLYCDENTAAGGTIRGLALNDKHLLHLITATHLVQILLAANFSSADAPMDTEETAEGSAWVKLFMAVRKEAGQRERRDTGRQRERRDNRQRERRNTGRRRERRDNRQRERRDNRQRERRNAAGGASVATTGGASVATTEQRERRDNRQRDDEPLQTAVIPSGWQLQTYVRESVLPFLRCSALFFHCHTGVQSSAELQESGVSEFEPLCQYLALPPDLSSLLQQNSDVGNGYSVPHTIHSKWCQYPGIKESLASGPASLVKYPIAVNKLVPLPQDYSDVINKGSVFTCPRSDGDDSRAPTMCLVCGQMLCSQSYCCQTDLDGEPVGACTAHIYTCGAGVGIFLRWVYYIRGVGIFRRVRECQILLLTGKTKGCFYPSPYLDDYGEHDQGLRRGNPLYLCQERYKKLQKLWLSHSIPEEVVHFMEANASFATIEWQHL
ncbi:UBR2 [Branchiostoma lanceolatum]|uniref:E3 ubiquitin-protein ligase n=1 Tax=Branchiostoma lanceolatum TaxID=7740 RepID=A0A8K0A009_BRALA|nr:UBR2 [Branchiostoma lanceolatum]